ncbi:MAG: chorismate synthase [Campylobacteraceae bacterium]
MNSFGNRFCITTFGESHGVAIGCVVDGVPAGLSIDEAYIQAALDRRKPGQNKFATSRKESDVVQILSGVFEGVTTGTPIALVIFNENQKSKDYDNVKDIFRPGHADFTYFMKYGFRDYRGGGRSSARETAARVAAGAIATKLLSEFGIKVQSGICQIGEIKGSNFDFEYAKTSEIYALDSAFEESQKELIVNAKKDHDSVGGCAFIQILNAPIGLGEPLYAKLDAKFSEALMGINGVKAVEIGEGVKASSLRGSANNDEMNKEKFFSNHSGGILGGISSGEPIELRVHFKPTPSIFKEQSSRDVNGESVNFSLKGRHDPCIAVRGSVVAEMMSAIILADMLLLNATSKLESLKKVYM